MSLVCHGPWPPNPHHIAWYKRLSTTSDARRGVPVKPVHPVEGKPCDRIYARRYVEYRVYCVMSDAESEALSEAEAAYTEAERECAEAERKMSGR